ncbi:MAG: type II toxin-antitoxin system VapC family toxin [Gammaproteobacteria bacterium]|jgi:predicted nucleic-acid-binding protein|nr:type II toxin-antitoxin system VapC family toxin [Gammaproteobacteria bacterium]
MIGIDTNVLMRLLVRDHEGQVKAAERFVNAHCSGDEPGHVSRIVIAEIAWVLKDIYGYDRAQITSAIRGILNVSQLEIDSADEVHRAVADYEKSSAGFTDCLVARLNASAGCEYTVTFDRKAAKLGGFKLLPGA